MAKFFTTQFMPVTVTLTTGKSTPVLSISEYVYLIISRFNFSSEFIYRFCLQNNYTLYWYCICFEGDLYTGEYILFCFVDWLIDWLFLKHKKLK